MWASSKGHIEIVRALAHFRIQDSPVMEPALAAQFPEIKSYRGKGTEKAAMAMRCIWSPRGLHAFLTDGVETISIHPARWNNINYYVSYYGKDYATAAQEARCLVNDARIVSRFVPSHSINSSVGSTLRTYRIAIATTQEYTNAPNLGGGTVASTITSLSTWLSAVNMIYEKELSIRLNLIANNQSVIYQSEPDPFTNGNVNAMADEVRRTLRDQIGEGNYDIGHVLGTGSGGVAYVGVVCSTTSDAVGPYKGGGATLVCGAVGNATDVGVLAHEIGHQLQTGLRSLPDRAARAMAR
jgi:hypothetical protein